MVPELVWTEEDRTALAEVIERIDPAKRPPVQAYRQRLSEDDYSFVISYIQREIQGSLVTGAAIDAIAEAVVHEGAADRGHALEFARRPVFRSRNFGIVDESDQRFTRLSLSEAGSGLATIVEALRAEAEAIYFGQSYTVRPADIDLTLLEEPEQGPR